MLAKSKLNSIENLMSQALMALCKYQRCKFFLKKDFAIQIIMDCRTKPAVKFRTRLGFNQYDRIMRHEPSILSKFETIFAAEKIKFEYYVLGKYRIDAYFPKYRLAIEIGKRGHNNRDIEHEIERQEAIKEKIGCKSIRINPAIKHFDVFVEISRVHNFIVKSNKELTEKSTKNSVMNDIRVGLVELSLKLEKNTKTIHRFLRRAFNDVSKP